MDSTTWTAEDVGRWLVEIGLGQYSTNFVEERITGDFLLLHCNDEAILTDLGITSTLHRRRIAFELAKLSEKSNQHATLVETTSAVAPSAATNRRKRKAATQENLKSTDRQYPIVATSVTEFSSGIRKQPKAKARKLGEEGSGAVEEHSRVNDIDDCESNLLLTSVTSKDLLDIFCIEIAKSSRSKCRVCSLQISKDTVKVGLCVFYKVHGRTYPGQAWFHPQCSFQIKYQLNVSSTNHPPSSGKRISKSKFCGLCKLQLFPADTDADAHSADDSKEKESNVSLNPVTSKCEDNKQPKIIICVGSQTSSYQWFCFTCLADKIEKIDISFPVKVVDIAGYEDLALADRKLVNVVLGEKS